MCALVTFAPLVLFGSLVFQPSRQMPDLSLKCMVPNNAKANPVEMPRASAYLVTDRDGSRLEDRFDVVDLWLSESMRARWVDEDGNRFSICRIPRMIPDAGGATRTRVDFRERYAKAWLGPKDLEALDDAVYLLAPVEVTDRFAPRRAQRKNLSALWQYDTTNDNAFVYAFRPRAEGKVQTDWYMVALVSDDLEAAEKMDKWLDDVEWIEVPDSRKRTSGSARRPSARRKSPIEDRELELLASDYRRNVVNYGDWHFASASNVVVVDNMTDTDRLPFISALTNGFPLMQAAYREALPSPLLDDSHVAAVRVFGSREEYLNYVGWEMKWSAALWSPQHRELVLYYPVGGSETLLRTVWHEALHQHLDYACSMIQMPPWFNEGHAVLFEYTHFDMDGNVVFDLNPDAVQTIKLDVSALQEPLLDLLEMDYPEFYDGTSEERQLKYHLAWSMAYFLQVGAPKVRFQPFKSLRSDLMEATVRSRRRDEAMRTVMNDGLRKDLVAEWLSFWKKN